MLKEEACQFDCGFGSLLLLLAACLVAKDIDSTRRPITARIEVPDDFLCAVFVVELG